MNATSKISSKAQTVVPRPIREHLGLKAGDSLAYSLTEAGVVISKLEPAPADDDEDWPGDPFACFTEWASPEDEEAFKDL